MKLTSNFKWIALAAIAVLAVCALAGHPLVSPEVVAGLGMAPMMIGETADVGSLAKLIEQQGEAWNSFQKANDARLKAIEEKGYAPADLTEKVEKINKDLNDIAKSMGEIEKKANRPALGGGDAQVTPEQAEYRKAFAQYLRTGEGDGRALKELGRKAMNTGSDPDGGYLVLPEMDRAIDRIAQTMGGLASLADSITIGTNKYEKVVKTAGMAMRRVGDGQTGGETTEPVYTKVAIEVFSAEVEPWVYNETLEDAFIDLEADLANEAAIGFSEGANAEFITGNGVNKARGIAAYTMVANSSFAWGSVGYILSGKGGAFMSTANAPADRVIQLQHALKAQYRQGAVWLANDATIGVLRQLKDASGQYYLWQPDPAGAFGGRILGAPVQVDDNVADIGAGSLSLAYLNPKRAYKIVNRSGTTLIRDNITAKGTTKFNFRRRFGGGIQNFEAVKWMKFAST